MIGIQQLRLKDDELTASLGYMKCLRIALEKEGRKEGNKKEKRKEGRKEIWGVEKEREGRRG